MQDPNKINTNKNIRQKLVNTKWGQAWGKNKLYFNIHTVYV